MKNILFPYAVKHAAQVRSLEVIDIDGVVQTRAEHLTGELPPFAKKEKKHTLMHRWGEAGTVKITPKNAPKSHERGVTCLFACYAAERPGDCYVMLDPVTLQSYKSRDVTWTKRSNFQKNANVS